MSFPFDEGRFRQCVDQAVVRVRSILDDTRSPTYPADVPHSYDDKFGLAEFVANTSITAVVQCFQQLGLTDAILARTIDEVQKQQRYVTLRLEVARTCSYVGEATRQIESATQLVTESTLFGKTTQKMMTTVTEHTWKIKASWELQLQLLTHEKANRALQTTVLQRRQTAYNAVTVRNVNPLNSGAPSSSAHSSPPQAPLDLDATWIFEHLQTSSSSSSSSSNSSSPRAHLVIDRANLKCHTPRRNPQIDRALQHHEKLSHWAKAVVEAFPERVGGGNEEDDDVCDKLMRSMCPSLLLPNVALLDGGLSTTPTAINTAVGAVEGDAEESKEDLESRLMDLENARVTHLLRVSDVERILEQHRVCLETACAQIRTSLPADEHKDETKIVSSMEVCSLMMLFHLTQLAQTMRDGVEYIEVLLRRQLMAAVGKEVRPSDLADFLRFHYTKVFRPEFQPKPFSFAVRRPNHSPEGDVSVETVSRDPIYTLQRHVDASHHHHQMQFAINASTNVAFGGDRVVHAWITQQFEDSPRPALSLAVRARQFSCFLLLVGNIGSASVFQPKHAIIVQNKDEVLLPLILECLPSAKAFADAIESMSPEQQRFAKSIRSMQLESSMFGVCVVQLKPQLEKLLRLEPDSLTKEIQLTQRLLELFIQYQIPADLLSYAGDTKDASATKIEAVKGYVKGMYEMVEQAKKEAVEEAKQKAAAATATLVALRAAEEQIMHRNISRTLDRGESLESMVDKSEVLELQSCTFYRQSAPVKKSAIGGFLQSLLSSNSSNSSNSKRSTSNSAAAAKSLSSSSSSSSSTARETAPVHRIVNQSAILERIQAPPSSSNRTESADWMHDANEMYDDLGASSIPPTNAKEGRTQQAQQTVSPLASRPTTDATNGGTIAVTQGPRDWTQLPVTMDKVFLQHAANGGAALQPIIIKLGPTWTRRRQATLLAPCITSQMNQQDQIGTRNEAYDLLDALSRSGALCLDAATLHIVVAVTHNFEATLIDTIIQDNVNPIEQLERSALLVASTLFDTPTDQLAQEQFASTAAAAAAGGVIRN